MKRNDLLLALAVVLIAGILYVLFAFGRDAGNSVTITVDGKNPQTYLLSEDMTTEIQGFHGGICTVEIKDGEISVKEATCPDHSCVKQGWIGKNGDTIACLPNRVLIVVNGQAQQEFDSVAK